MSRCPGLGDGVTKILPTSRSTSRRQPVARRVCCVTTRYCRSSEQQIPLPAKKLIEDRVVDGGRSVVFTAREPEAEALKAFWLKQPGAFYFRKPDPVDVSFSFCPGTRTCDWMNDLRARSKYQGQSPAILAWCWCRNAFKSLLICLAMQTPL